MALTYNKRYVRNDKKRNDKKRNGSKEGRHHEFLLMKMFATLCSCKPQNKKE